MWGGCWGRCGDADACVLFIFDLLIRAAVKEFEIDGWMDLEYTSQRAVFGFRFSVFAISIPQLGR